MAIRSIAQLKAWFKRGKYPTEAQFADWIDSFFHKEEDKVPISSVEGLPEQLNGKYDAAAGEQLESNFRQLRTDYEAHEKSSREQFNNIADNIEELEAEDERQQGEIDALNTEVENIHKKDAAQDEEIEELHKTDTALQTSLTAAHDDIGKIREMLKSGATLAEAKAALVALGANYKDLYAVASTLKTFLQSKDTADATINTWQEIESFLQGITDAQSLTTLLSQLETKITTAYNTAIAAAVKTEKERAEAAELEVSRQVDREKTRAEAAESALDNRITQTKAELKQTDVEIKQDIAAVRQTMLGILAESAGRVIPLVVNVTPPRKITLGNTVTQYIKAELLPSFAVQNVLFLGDGKAVEVDPDGAVQVLGLGKSRVHVIPTENTALHKTVEIEVVRPSALKDADGGLLVTAGNNILLT
jgi:predicted  nucleic acid-binding Zn-ribbon protein|nr:MAG TPA: Macoilin family [Caudoviricetes sp.]